MLYLNWRNRRRGQGEYTTAKTALWHLGRWAPAVNVVAIIWVAVITVIFSLPPNELVLWTFLLLSGGLTLYWFGYARRHFTGPTPLDEAELRRIAHDLAALAEGKPEVAPV